MVLVRDLGQIMIRSDLSELSLRRLVCIQDLMLVRQLERVERVAEVMDLVEIWSR